MVLSFPCPVVLTCVRSGRAGKLVPLVVSISSCETSEFWTWRPSFSSETNPNDRPRGSNDLLNLYGARHYRAGVFLHMKGSILSARLVFNGYAFSRLRLLFAQILIILTEF